MTTSLVLLADVRLDRLPSAGETPGTLDALASAVVASVLMLFVLREWSMPVSCRLKPHQLRGMVKSTSRV